MCHLTTRLPRWLPRPRTGFVGRERELAELMDGFADAVAGNGRLFLVVGEPGIGKTRLALEVAGHAAARGGRVLWGRCWEGGGAPAYWPWVQAIRTYVRNSDANTLLAQLPAGAVYLAHLVPELRARLPQVPAADGVVGLDSEDARFQLFDAVAGFLRNARQPLVLILDDIHAADQPSLLLLHFVARELRDIPLLLIGTYREVDARRSAWRAALLGNVARESRHLSLRGLSADAVARFIAQSARQAPPAALVDAVYAATEGNPFFVDEVVRLLAAEGRLQGTGRGPLDGFRIPDEVREAIHRRLDPLPDDTREACSRGDHRPRVRRRGTARGGRARSHVASALGEVNEARIGRRMPPGRYAFSHALMRDTLYEDQCRRAPGDTPQDSRGPGAARSAARPSPREAGASLRPCGGWRRRGARHRVRGQGRAARPRVPGLRASGDALRESPPRAGARTS